jgi:hypothetical protein
MAALRGEVEVKELVVFVGSVARIQSMAALQGESDVEGERA